MGQHQNNSESIYQEEENVLSIDINNLEQEWSNQPLLYFKYAVKLANARIRMDEAKDALKLKEAEIQADIRENPEKYSIPRVTEASVEKWTLMQDDYKDALDTYNRRRGKVGLLEAMVDALDHRKKALEKEVELFTSQYYAKPRVAEGAREAMEDSETRRLYEKGRRK